MNKENKKILLFGWIWFQEILLFMAFLIISGMVIIGSSLVEHILFNQALIENVVENMFIIAIIMYATLRFAIGRYFRR